jgi:hypothetical protein
MRVSRIVFNLFLLLSVSSGVALAQKTPSKQLPQKPQKLQLISVAAKPLPLTSIYHKLPSEVDKVLGQPRSIGRGNSFREYALPTAGVSVRFKGQSVVITATFITAFDSPEAALAAVGVNVKGKPIARQNILERHYFDIGGIKHVSAKSIDGVHWETVELADV